MKPVISIIIPTYSPKEYLWECLDSIYNQTLSNDYFEVVIILNGDKEPYYSSIKQHIGNYKMSINLLYSNIKGVSAARNLGLDNVQGKYVCFIDDDDWISNNYLENLLSKAIDNGIVISNVIVVDEKTKSENNTHFLSLAYSNYAPKFKKSLYRNRSFFSSACCKIIPLKCIGNNRFNTHIKRGEDSVFMFSISCKIKYILASDYTCVYYIRKRNNSAGRAKMNLFINTYEFISQSYKYTYLYIKHMFNNDFLFFLSRIVGTFFNKFVQNKQNNE